MEPSEDRLREDLIATIMMYYQTRFDCDSARYYVSREHIRLLKKRAAAERNPGPLCRLRKVLDTRPFDAYDYFDTTLFVDNSCYRLEILLKPGEQRLGGYDHDSDVENIRRFGGMMPVLFFFVSFLAPVYYWYVMILGYDEEADNFTRQFMHEVDAEHRPLVEALVRVLPDYRFVSYDILSTPIEVQTDAGNEGVCLKDCLFTNVVYIR